VFFICLFVCHRRVAELTRDNLVERQSLYFLFISLCYLYIDITEGTFLIIIIIIIYI